MRLKLFAILFAALLFAGCQTNLTARRIQAKNPIAKNAAKTPTKFVDVWNTYAQSTPDGKAMRGIAGRIHFYSDEAKKRAVKVDGDVTVFVFDADEKDPAHAKPLQIYRFPADTLQKHYAHKKPLGHGYDFFLPFDELGGEEKRLCVMTRFDDRLDDGFVLSQPVNTVLQGTKPLLPSLENSEQPLLAANSISSEANPIQQVTYEQSAAANESELPPHNISERSTPERNISTVILNESLSRRLVQ